MPPTIKLAYCQLDRCALYPDDKPSPRHLHFPTYQVVEHTDTGAIITNHDGVNVQRYIKDDGTLDMALLKRDHPQYVDSTRSDYRGPIVVV